MAQGWHKGSASIVDVVNVDAADVVDVNVADVNVAVVNVAVVNVVFLNVALINDLAVGIAMFLKPSGLAPGRLFHAANFFAPATHPTAHSVTIIIMALTVSCSSKAASARPKKGCSSCSCPTPAIPPTASPRYQKMKPISMLKTDT